MKRVPAIVQDYRTPLFRKMGIRFRRKIDADNALRSAQRNNIPARVRKVLGGYHLTFSK